MEIDESIERFGLWSVLDRSSSRWLCRCDCGTKRRVPRADLISSRSKGCGCARYENAGKAAAAANTTHGLGNSPEMRIWIDMKRRCYQPHRPDYPRYGGRGITVCDRWKDSFEAFIEDMGLRPPGMTLDRIDNNAPYSPKNCRWATKRQQGRNQRTNVRYDVFGKSLTLPEAAERYGIATETIRSRLNRGWTIEDAVTKTLR